jgi:hypothetical protein
MAAEEEEQVLGVLKRCPVCDEKTLHVGGVCQDHKVVRRKKQRAAGQAVASAAPARRRAPAPAPAPAPPPPKKRGYLGRFVSLLVLGGLIYLFGALHVVHGDASGLRVCWKDGWSLADTIVNSDDVAAKKPFDKKVLSALATCGL